MSSSDGLDAATLVLILLGAVVVLPLLVMGVGWGMGGMMGYGGPMGEHATTGGWWPFIGLLVPLVFLLVLLGGGYLVVQRASGHQSSRDPALAELRMAYARGDLSDEEFETRREALERSE